MTKRFELGLDTFGDVTVDADGRAISQSQVLRNVVEEGVLADQVDLDFFGVGEHHRSDFAVSAPEVVLAGIAGRTEKIHLGSAVTVLSSDDPVRVYQRFATLDGISGGRAEVILGRGSFTESFPLFGLALSDYEELFDEKLDLFAQLRHSEAVTWSGNTRSSLVDQVVYPTTEAGPLKTWVGVGGSPESVVRAARYGMPLMLAIIGGEPSRFKPLVELYGRALEHYGHEPQPIGVHSPGFVARTDGEARDQMWPHYAAMQARIGRDRGWSPMTRAQFDMGADPDGAIFVGSPETVAKKIVRVADELGVSRFDLKYSHGTLPHDLMMTGIELYGSQVAPQVRSEVAQRAEQLTPA
ncbi:MAG: LLM class flavin-dependent oxidoreductase [Microthrixaceae bacterium]